MSRDLIVRSEAEADIVDGQDWCEDQRFGLRKEFLDAIEDTFYRIRNSPELYAIEYRTVRIASLKRFPYVVYFRLLEGSIEVIAVLHCGRDPRTWQSRIRSRKKP